ncbi:lytic murein transglycosylase [Alteromonas sp. ASW11-36]|uniref:Lytic murein transglycosylase n=1 Tax=Alteromonas arenosi TaxID=3055817 RepID=A0ABT7T1G5_9ALTE|nr:lytic murein transglycosylase [Alteromonas sp. ASW11-36]MDM7862282.1 lytic murein transglycosylase [Alteromonas sp. ASW11-36]
MLAATASTSTASDFKQCLGNLGQLAESRGVSADTQVILSGLEYQAKVIELDRNQPEFVQTFPAYFSKRVNDWRINKGREKYAEHRELLAELTARYGVPGHYLVAFWGLETNYGGYKGNMPTLDSLATLACDQRRQAFFTEELLLALLLVDRENLDPATMQGSWAGAMGHTQFMPSTYTQYAVDGDGDGVIDLWNSEADALTSAANFLARLGWQSGSRWGREIVLPDTFDYSLAGYNNRRTLTEWQSTGITMTDGSVLPESELLATLRVPAGHAGPAFLTYANFRTIMRWNNSEFYAIAVGHLADRIVNGPGLSVELPNLPPLSRVDIMQLQRALTQLGFDVGGVDGIMGPGTRAGIRAYQVHHNLIADGFPSVELRQHVLAQLNTE